MEIKKLSKVDIKPDFIKTFHHKGEWYKQWEKENGKWTMVDKHVVEGWDDEKREWYVDYLTEKLENGGYILGAYEGNKLLGFCSLDSNKYHPQLINGYLNMDFLFVDDDYHRQGIGSKLFKNIAEEAKRRGANKLYIAAVPSQDTIAFYKAMGCKDVEKIIPDFMDSNYDRHIEFCL